jgi:hypothetical protein
VSTDLFGLRDVSVRSLANSAERTKSLPFEVRVNDLKEMLGTRLGRANLRCTCWDAGKQSSHWIRRRETNSIAFSSGNGFHQGLSMGKVLKGRDPLRVSKGRTSRSFSQLKLFLGASDGLGMRT